MNGPYWSFDPEFSPDRKTLFHGRFDSGVGNTLWQVPLSPLQSVSLTPSSGSYQQNFDETLGVDGGITEIDFPVGWSLSENSVIFEGSTTEPFPIGAGFARNSIFNAGAEDSADRALAIGPHRDSDQLFVQLLSDIVGIDATSFQLQFDVEAWDAADGTFVPPLNTFLGGADEPGEAAFAVTVDVDTGGGFTSSADFDRVTTGLTLQPVLNGVVDGNADANRVSFDSGEVTASIPAGSQLRVRWLADTETVGWVFGLDNVSLSLHSTSEVARDFNADGLLDVVDLDRLTSEIRAAASDMQFDLNGDGQVDADDRAFWITDLKQTYYGDVDLNGRVNANDPNTLAINWHATDATSWGQGDFNGDGNVSALDLNALALNWRSGVVGAAFAHTLAEPSSAALLLFGGLMLIRGVCRPVG